MQRKGGGYEISTRVGLESGVCTKYIKVLLELGILKKETPITEKPGKKTVYMIEDNFFCSGKYVSDPCRSYGTGLRTGGEKHYSDYMGMRQQGEKLRC